MLNHYQQACGLPKVATRFLEGSRMGIADPAQIQYFERMKPWLDDIARTGRALIVSESISSGGSVGGIAWRLHEAGFTCDIFAPGDVPDAVDLMTRGVWPPGTRAFAGEDDP